MAAPAETSIFDVDESTKARFLSYALAHGAEHDDSYTIPEELDRFDFAAEPAVVALDAAGAVLGAASAMVAGYAEGGNARLRILNATDPALYPPMIERVMERLPNLVRRVFCFLPEDAGPAEAALGSAGFAATRRAYLLSHLDPKHVHLSDMPGNTVLKQAYPMDGPHWAHIVNAACHGEPGRYDMSVDRARELLARRRVIREGTLVAWRDDLPAGVVMTVADPDDAYAAEIETIAVIPADQGVGIGRVMLRSALMAVARDGRTSATLSVSATNRRALSLYLDAGFGVRDVRVCWEKAR